MYIWFVVATASKKVKLFVDKTYQNDFLKNVHQLRQREEYTDVTLQSGDVRIQCHRVVLAVGSKYFQAMFRCGLQKHPSDTVELTMEPEILSSIVDYIYSGEIELTVDNVESIVKASDILQLDALKASCEDFMMTQVDVTNCCSFHRLSQLYQLHKVLRKAKGLMLAEFKAVAFGDQFKELSCSELIDLINDDDVNVDDEDVVVQCVLDWVNHDAVKRKSSLEAVLERTRLPFCTPKYLCHMKSTCDMLTHKCVEYLDEAVRFQVDPAHQHEVSSCRTQPRTHFNVKPRLLVVGGLTCSQEDPFVKKNLCQFYDEDTSRWEKLTEMPPSVGWFYSVCCVGRSLLLTGGITEDEAANQCWLYDLATKKWEAMPPLNTARFCHRSVSMGDCVYVVGGLGVVDNNVLASVECFNVKRRQWSAMPDLPRAVMAVMVVTYGNSVFVFGGRDEQNVALSCTQVLDTTRGQWTTRSDSPEACNVGAAVTFNDFVYVVGGGYNTCLQYNPATDTWKRLSQPRGKHANAPAVVWRGCILVAGGGGPNSESSVIEQYDPVTDTWSDWRSELGMKLEGRDMLNVDLYDV